MEKLKSYIKPYTWFILLTMSIKFVASYLDLNIPNLREQRHNAGA